MGSTGQFLNLSKGAWLKFEFKIDLLDRPGCGPWPWASQLIIHRVFLLLTCLIIGVKSLLADSDQGFYRRAQHRANATGLTSKF